MKTLTGTLLFALALFVAAASAWADGDGGDLRPTTHDDGIGGGNPADGDGGE